MGDVVVLIKADDAFFLPEYGTEYSSGADVKACIDDDIELMPGERVMVSVGFYVEIPVGYELQVRPRSGYSRRDGVTVLNTPGTIDSDYRGEVSVILINHGEKVFKISRGMRIAQIVLCPVLRAKFCSSEKLTITGRGEGGFGHTGAY